MLAEVGYTPQPAHTEASKENEQSERAQELARELGIEADSQDYALVEFLAERYGELITTQEIFNPEFRQSWNKDDHYSEGTPKTPDIPEYLTQHIVAFYHSQELPTPLPEGYAYMGGVPRAILFAEMGNAIIPPRDLDIVAIDDFNPDMELASEISEHYMPRDNQHGYGVKTDSFANYFRTRDFTINEVLAYSPNTENGGWIYTTLDALRDARNKTIRPTAYEQGDFYHYPTESYGISNKLAVKALRLSAEFTHYYGEGNIQNIADWQWQLDNIPLFYLALNLEKAYEQGDALATRFYTKLLEFGVINNSFDAHPLEAAGPANLAMNIRYRMQEEGRDPFCFTQEELNRAQAPLSQEEQELINTDPDYAMYVKYARMANNYIGASEY